MDAGRTTDNEERRTTDDKRRWATDERRRRAADDRQTDGPRADARHRGAMNERTAMTNDERAMTERQSTTTDDGRRTRTENRLDVAGWRDLDVEERLRHLLLEVRRGHALLLEDLLPGVDHGVTRGCGGASGDEI